MKTEDEQNLQSQEKQMDNLESYIKAQKQEARKKRNKKLLKVGMLGLAVVGGVSTAYFAVDKFGSSDEPLNTKRNDKNFVSITTNHSAINQVDKLLKLYNVVLENPVNGAKDTFYTFAEFEAKKNVYLANAEMLGEEAEALTVEEIIDILRPQFELDGDRKVKAELSLKAINISEMVVKLNVDFGDGTTKDFDTNATHIYEKAGNYNIIVTAFDDEGHEVSESMEIEVTEENTEAAKIYTRNDVVKMPGYKGGKAAVVSHIQDNLRYPKAAKKNNINGRVVVQFVIDEKSKVSDIKVLQGLGYGCDEEAMRVIKKMKGWIAGEKDGAAVPVLQKMAINFKLVE